MVNNNTNPDTMRKRINNLESANYAEEIEVLNTDIENIFENTAPEYDKTQTYNEGDFVISEGVLYKAKQTTTGDFDPTKWESTSIVANLGGGSSIKTKEYTGNGGYTITIEFDDTPTYILGIFQKALDNQLPQFYNAFPFVSGKTVAQNLDGGTVKGEVVTLTVSGNNLTIAGNAYFCNGNEDYIILYV